MCNSYFADAMTALMQQTAEILRPTDQKDRFGAVSNDKTIVVHRYSCRVMADRVPRNSENIAEKSVVRSEWRILLPLTAEVRSDDKIRVGGIGYEVLDTDQGRAGASFLTIFARKTI